MTIIMKARRNNAMQSPDTKQLIVNVFINLLRERPFDKITIIDIAKKAHINRNTFYYYFSDVIDLLSYIIERSKTEYIENREDIDTLNELITLFINTMDKDRSIMRNLFSSRDVNTVIRLFDETVREICDICVERELSTNPEFSIEEKKAIAEFYSTILEGFTIRIISSKDPENYISQFEKLRSILESRIPYEIIREELERS